MFNNIQPINSYKGACDTGGFPSMEHQQEKARDGMRAAIAAVYTMPQIDQMLQQNASLLGGVSWALNIQAYLRKDTNGKLDDSDYRKLTALVNGWYA